jgi:predicted unusual protein kinase regulating ubiquinone biosynthesis (AarF/ABC1/UbiB family)
VWRRLAVPWVLRRGTPPRAQRVQQALEDLGGTWIKLGQALALRFDLLPADYCLQFFELLNRVRPFPAAAVRRVLEDELRQPVEALFQAFDWQPLAAASIGQVHRAELLDGTAVAVKIQRPDIRALIAADLRLMRWMAAIVDALPYVGRLRARQLVREFARWTEEELDYRVEARHASILRANAADDPLEHNPVVHSAYTTSRVLTLDYLPGVPLIDIHTAIRRGDRAFLEALAAQGHDVRRIASHIVWNGLNQIYRFGYFHADPHPANLVVLPDDAIGYVDFGIVGKLDEATTDSLRYFAESLFAGRVGKAVDEFMRFLTPSAATDLAAARGALIEALQRYLEGGRVNPVGPDLADGIFEVEMLTIIRTHAMALAPDAVRYLKAVLTAEAVVKELDPQFDLRAHENRFFRRLMAMELGEMLTLDHAARWLLEARHRLDGHTESAAQVREDAPAVGAEAPRARRRVQGLLVIALASLLVVIGALLAPPAGDGPRWAAAVIGGAGLLALIASLVRLRR